MRTLTGLLLVLIAVAAASLTADRSHVDSQARGPNRAYAPGAGRVIIHLGQATPQPLERWWKVVIRVTAQDEQPEIGCCADLTKIQLESIPDRISETQLTGVGQTLYPPKMTLLSGVPPASEFCTETIRTFLPSFPQILIAASESIFTGVGIPYVILKVEDVIWQYRCLNDTLPGDPHTQRDLYEDYLEKMFAKSSFGLIFSTPTNPGPQPPSCITHHAEHVGGPLGDLTKATAAIHIFIYVKPCTLPDFPFPY